MSTRASNVLTLPVHYTQRTKPTGCLTRYFFTRTENKRAVIETGKKPKRLVGCKPTMRIWKRLTSSEPLQNPIRVARKYEQFLHTGDHSYADAARRFDVSRVTICHYVALVQRLPADFVSWLEAQDDVLVLTCFCECRLREVTRLGDELAQRQRLAEMAREARATAPDTASDLGALLDWAGTVASPRLGKELRAICLDG